MKKLYLYLVRALTAFDWPLLTLLALMAALGLTVMHSAVGGADGRFADQTHHFLFAFLVLWVAALISPKGWKILAPVVYVVAVVLLLGVEFFGVTSKGATRWLEIGFTRIQPSEMSKIAVPLMVAWFFDRNQTGNLRLLDFIGASVLLLLPFLLIVKQPDLGTALLVFAAGFCVIYFAGLSFKLLAPVVIILVLVIGGLLYYEDTICQQNFDWVVLREYQKNRVCTLLNPSSDPLGKGFHTIQSMIAIGSGGVYGKGYMAGTQSHLDFIPERTTDFIFAVFAEEFGLYGGVMLLVLYGLMIARGLSITVAAQTQFERLLAGSMSMMLFVYVFVNVGMVTGILPVVGVPLPFLSYGGTALMTLGVASGILMSVSRSKPARSQT